LHSPNPSSPGLDDLKTPQDYFSFIYLALMKQGCGSREADGLKCLYRADKTPECPIRCGIGHIIPDAAYTPSIETIAANQPTVFNIIGGQFREYLEPLWDSHTWQMFFANLQNAHDTSFGEPERFRREFSHAMRYLSDKYSLTIPAYEEA